MNIRVCEKCRGGEIDASAMRLEFGASNPYILNVRLKDKPSYVRNDCYVWVNLDKDHRLLKLFDVNDFNRASIYSKDCPYYAEHLLYDVNSLDNVVVNGEL